MKNKFLIMMTLLFVLIANDSFGMTDPGIEKEKLLVNCDIDSSFDFVLSENNVIFKSPKAITILSSVDDYTVYMDLSPPNRFSNKSVNKSSFKSKRRARDAL